MLHSYFIRHPELGSVEINSENISITLVVNKDTAKVIKNSSGISKEEILKLEVPAKVVTGRTFIPGRFVAEALGAKVEWNPSLHAVIIEKPIVYKNTQYGFDFSLPNSWKDYSLVTDKWEGSAIGDTQSNSTAQTGPIISIRHPKWTTQSQRQDIPIMIFTLAQWNALQEEAFHIGAAPIGPSELSRNTKYVFALPARYNFAFKAGYEEVEQLLSNNPLRATSNNL